MAEEQGQHALLRRAEQRVPETAAEAQGWLTLVAAGHRAGSGHVDFMPKVGLIMPKLGMLRNPWRGHDARGSGGLGQADSSHGAILVLDVPERTRSIRSNVEKWLCDESAH
jgi:hypothetical protein